MYAWQVPDAEVDALVGGHHADPFSLLGPHEVAEGLVIRAFVPYADTLDAVETDGTPIAMLSRRHDSGLFEGFIAGRPAWARYRLLARNAGGEWTLDDPYSFGPVLGPMDDYLLVEGTHKALYERLGAHPCEHEGVEGVRFAVWAPNASRVSVVGDFNQWDGRRHQMRKRIDSGLWEIFAPGVGEGTIYKYEIVAADGRLLPLKADPFGFRGEFRPATGSVVARTDNFEWHDEAHIAARNQGAAREKPMAIYEVHLGSWRRGEGNRFLTYDELADQLIGYAAWMGFTHIELLPVSEHPLDASWGYQPIGLFAPTSRFGDPAGFARFVDRAHQAGLSVILDWVPAHFPTDIHGLAHFDGGPLYEHSNPQRGFHPDWNTAIYDFGRREVANMLIANALYWLDRFHIGGLRVDAVASMLYLDYSRKPGEWIPNDHGGRENVEAVAFLQGMNKALYADSPGVMTIAEESTSWPQVSAPVHQGGLGFGFKWNMGFMHDTLRYLAREPVHRQHHHDDITFGLLYAFSENFVLALSHDEVVHGKSSLLHKMAGDDWQKFATLRAYYAFMWGYPGKKLLFMGQEFAQRAEWSEERSLDWHLLGDAAHVGVQRLVCDLNRTYRAHPALHARDCEGEGFAWVLADAAADSIFAWVRRAPGARPVVVVSHFTPVLRHGYRMRLPSGGRWREILNSDAREYGGGGVGNMGMVHADEEGWANITIPPFSTLMLELDD